MSEVENVPTRNVPWRGLAITTAVAAVAAFLLNLGIGAAVRPPTPVASSGAALVDAGTPAVEEGGAIAAVRRLSEQQYLEGILERNIFDQSKIGLEPEAPAGGGEGGPQASDLSATLIGTVVAEPATFSAALIQLKGETSPYAYGIGQKVMGAEVLEILDDRVKIRRTTGREEWLFLGEPKEDAGAKTAASAPPPDEGIATEGDKVVVSRDLLDEKLNDVASLAREARALLHRGPDGDYDGYRLSAIRRGSLADQLGIRNGDIFHSVNGLDLTSMDGAMRALEQLRSESGLSFEVTRRGQPMTLEVEVR